MGSWHKSRKLVTWKYPWVYMGKIHIFYEQTWRFLYAMTIVSHFSGMVKEIRFKVTEKSVSKYEFSLRRTLSKLCLLFISTKTQDNSTIWYQVSQGESSGKTGSYGSLGARTHPSPQETRGGEGRLLGKAAYSSHTAVLVGTDRSELTCSERRRFFLDTKSYTLVSISHFERVFHS